MFGRGVVRRRGPRQCAGRRRPGDHARGTDRRLGYRSIRLHRTGQPGQGNPDSDTRLIITRSGIDNYEQTFKPVKAASVSIAPRAWNIRSTLTFDGESSRYQALYALDGGGRLTIIDGHRTETYSRCNTDSMVEQALR